MKIVTPTVFIGDKKKGKYSKATKFFKEDVSIENLTKFFKQEVFRRPQHCMTHLVSRALSRFLAHLYAGRLS